MHVVKHKTAFFMNDFAWLTRTRGAGGVSKLGSQAKSSMIVSTLRNLLENLHDIYVRVQRGRICYRVKRPKEAMEVLIWAGCV